MREVAYQMARQGRPAPADLPGSLRRLEAAGLVHRPYVGCDSYSATTRKAAA